MNGEIEGRGSKQWADGRRYEGDFSRGEACGEGRFTSPAGESYIGPWVQNKRQGRGQLVLPNGQGTYAGEFYRHRYKDPLGAAESIGSPHHQYETLYVKKFPPPRYFRIRDSQNKPLHGSLEL